MVREKLNQWGLDEQLHKPWMLRSPSVRLFKKRLVIWSTSIKDRIAMALAEIGHPVTARELMEFIQEESTRDTVLNVLKLDERMTKVGKEEWALASWSSPNTKGLPTASSPSWRGTGPAASRRYSQR